MDPNAIETETITERTLERDTEQHALITPPRANVSAANVAVQSATGVAVARAREEERVALFIANEANELRGRWDGIQVGFVDEPRKAVQEADALVSATISRLAEMFAADGKNRTTVGSQRECFNGGLGSCVAALPSFLRAAMAI